MKDQPYGVGVDVDRNHAILDLRVGEVFSNHEIKDRDKFATGKFHRKL